MERLHYVLITMLIVASLLFGGVLAYSHNKAKEKSFFIDSINTMNGLDTDYEKGNSLVVTEFSKKQLYLEPVGLTITEQRSIIAMMLVAILTYGLVCFFAVNERIKKGPNTFQIPLVFASILLSATFVFQSIFLGVL